MPVYILLSKGNLSVLCFRKFPALKKFLNKRRREHHNFPSKLFRLTIPKNFVGEPFGVSENFWCRKILCFRGLCHDSLSNFFLSHSTEKFRRGTNPTVLCFRKNPVLKKFMDKKRGGGGGVSRFSVENFLSHSAEKFRRGSPLCFTNFGYRKMLGISRKIFGTTETRTPNLLLENAVVLTLLLSIIFE